MALLSYYSSLTGKDLSNEYRFHRNYRENGFQKLQSNFESDPTVG
jgi:hypothetical protein